MQLYLNYQHRAFVFTHEMLAAMGKPAFVSLWVNYRTNVLLFEARRSRPKSGACWKIPDKVYEDRTSYAVGLGSPFANGLPEYIGKDVPAVVPVEFFDQDEVPPGVFRSEGRRKPAGRMMKADLKQMDTCFYTRELDEVYDQETPGRWMLSGNRLVYIG